MAAGQVVALPQDVAGGGVETGGAVAAEVNVHAARLDRGRRRRVAVDGVAEWLGIVAVKQFLVVHDFAGFGVDADGKELVAVFGRGGQPDLAVHDHRRGPAAVRNRRLPTDVFRFAPRERQADGRRRTRRGNMTVAVRPAKLGPVGAGTLSPRDLQR